MGKCFIRFQFNYNKKRQAAGFSRLALSLHAPGNVPALRFVI
jgi:hypothetical protein